MSHYEYTKQLKAVWEKAVALYAEGKRGSETYFDGDEQAFLDSIGMTAQEVYDFAEDFNHGGEPDFATFVQTSGLRRLYFIEVQRGNRSTEALITPASLPPKDQAVEGIDWLPRIIPKAKAKLKGIMDPDLMYGCGGDRRFFRDNDIHPAEFLRVVWDNWDNDQAVIDWVKTRKSELTPA